jgi:hypothetical protein
MSLLKIVHEVIVISNRSTDNTIQKPAEAAGATVLRKQKGYVYACLKMEHC